MAVMGQIPQYNFGEQFNPLTAFAKGYYPAKQQAEAARQQEQQFNLQQQLAQAQMQQNQVMNPLQQQMLQAQIEQEKAKTAAIPMEAQKELYKRNREAHESIVKQAEADPLYLSNPENQRQYKQSTNWLRQDAARQQSMYEPQNGSQSLQQQIQGMNNPNQQQMGLSPEEKDIYESNAISKNMPALTQEQMLFANSARGMYDEISKSMPVIANFSGLKGASQADFNKYASSLGMTPSEAFRQYNTFTQTQLPMFSKELNRSLGGSSAVMAHEIMQDMANPVSTWQDMQQALRKWDALGKLMEKNEESLIMTPAELRRSLKGKLSSNESNKNVPRGTQNTQGKILASDGVHYTREQLQKIAAGGG